MKPMDIVLIGGGIVGVATAWRLKQICPRAEILLMDKEDRVAAHQTGHNSGVIHAGVYYQPGSLKADFCKQGSALTLDFCKKHRIPVDQCGKLLVATDALEMKRMEALEIRCGVNHIHTRRLSARQLHRLEPNIQGLGALHVPATGITDYRKVTRTMLDLFRDLGGRVLMGREVTAVREDGSGVAVVSGDGSIRARNVIACAGLMADRVAAMMDIDMDFRIIPFRGEYYQLPARHNRVVSHLIYPVPDPDLPFLGVHLTRMIDGSVTVGPNAVMGWKREGYARVNLDGRDILDMIAFPGFWAVLRRNLVSGLSETRDSLYRPGYLERVRKYCPSVCLRDLKPYPAGIRAQAVKLDGTLVHDFLFAETPRSLHVCNAPSPAATSAIPIGRYLAEKAREKFGLD
ncbi:MAG: L-2-hydroxyglutarate oxidase [Pseudomonadota bacterium]